MDVFLGADRFRNQLDDHIAGDTESSLDVAQVATENVSARAALRRRRNTIFLDEEMHFLSQLVIVEGALPAPRLLLLRELVHKRFYLYLQLAKFAGDDLLVLLFRGIGLIELSSEILHAVHNGSQRLTTIRFVLRDALGGLKNIVLDAVPQTLEPIHLFGLFIGEEPLEVVQRLVRRVYHVDNVVDVLRFGLLESVTLISDPINLHLHLTLERPCTLLGVLLSLL